MAEPNLEGFITHARKFGCECVYETATDYLSTRELGELYAEMRTAHPKWNLSPEQRVTLVRNLIEEAEPTGEILRLTGLTERRLNQIRQEVSDASEIAA